MIALSPQNKLLFLPEPYIKKTVIYQNVNIDPKLRKQVTLSFHKKLLLWIDNNNDFKKYKKYIKKIDSTKGIRILYNILRRFVKNNDYNWYDLKEKHYEDLKDYILIKLIKYF